MAGLSSILSQSAGSLDAQEAVTQTISQNIDNASTPGYSLQTANLEAVLPADYIGGSFLGQGAELQSVTQSRNQFLEAQLPAAFGCSSASAALASTLTSLSALDPSATGGLATSIGSFYSALEALSQNAGDPGLRQAAVAAAQALAVSFNETSSSITTSRDGVDTQLGANVTQANSLASQIASLNAQIAAARATGAQPNDLLDTRQQDQDQLEQLTGAVPVPDAAGDANMMLPNGAALVDGDVSATLSTLPDAANDGHLDVQLTPAGSTTASTLGSGDLGGTMGGLIAARDGALETAGNQIDQLAFDLGSAVNAVQQAGFTEAGAPGQALFELPATASGAAGQIQVNATILADPTQLAGASSATSGVGDGSNFIAMLATANQALSGGTDASATLSNLTAEYGSAAQQAQNDSQASTAVLNNMQTLRQSTSGVNTTDEMTQLSQTQQVYQAITQVISTTNSMMETLITMTSTASTT